MKVFFTDLASGLTKQQAHELGVVLVDEEIVYEGDVVKDWESLVLDPDDEEDFVSSAAPNVEQYKEVFNKYPNKELVYVSLSHVAKDSQVFHNLQKENIPNLTIVDSTFMLQGQVEVLKRVMAGKPYDDLKYYFIIKGPKSSAIQSLANVTQNTKNKWCLYQMKNGVFVLLDMFDTKFVAKSKLKRLVNSPLQTHNDINISMWLFCGRNYMGGIWEKK